MEVNHLRRTLKDLEERSGSLTGVSLSTTTRKTGSYEVSRELEDPKHLGHTGARRRNSGASAPSSIPWSAHSIACNAGLADAAELLDLAVAEEDAATVQGVEADLGRLESDVRRLEFTRMFPGADGFAQRLSRHPGGSGRDRGPGLGGRCCCACT